MNASAAEEAEDIIVVVGERRERGGEMAEREKGECV
jgi:hypothetical protein